MELYMTAVDNGRWYYVWAACNTEASRAVEEWGTDGKVLGSWLVDGSKPIVMGSI